jgi:hypothetical protein
VKSKGRACLRANFCTNAEHKPEEKSQNEFRSLSTKHHAIGLWKYRASARCQLPFIGLAKWLVVLRVGVVATSLEATSEVSLILPLFKSDASHLFFR